jgi:uncharacterized protein YecT (DUF1311 family)
MHIRCLPTAIAIVALIALGCDDATKEQSPGEVLARDSSLASDLKQADTSAFAEAADVAMAFDPDSAVQPVARPAPAAVPMRVDRNAGAAHPLPTHVDGPAPPSSATRPPLRPAPATIHRDPLPAHPMPPASERVRTSSSAAIPSTASAQAILERVPGAALPPAKAPEPCASPAAGDQRRCLMAHLARSDVSLDRTYQALVTDLKRQAGTSSGNAEPVSVQDLRRAQRAWLVYRDTECRRRNRGKEGALWAPVRAQCLAEFSGVREAELARARRH